MIVMNLEVYSKDNIDFQSLLVKIYCECEMNQLSIFLNSLSYKIKHQY